MREIILKHGQVVLVDDDDFEYLSQFKWHYGNKITRPNPGGYPKRISMHREVMKCVDPKLEVDHINHNTSDNRKCNLRICSSGENTANRTAKKNGTSKYLGVYKRGEGHFVASIGKNRKTNFLGRYKTEEEAALAYNEAAKIYHGEFANLNKV